jgi:signal transduction histidine kinase
VGRIPLPLGAKLTAGFAVIAALLVIGYVLGLTALGQSNARGEQLLFLQRETAYDQVLLIDSNNLGTVVAKRTSQPPTAAKSVLSRLDADVSRAYATLATDFSQSTFGDKASLRVVGAKAVRNLESSLTTFQTLFTPIQLRDNAGRRVSANSLARIQELVRTTQTALNELATRTNVQADALVAHNDRDFHDSRSLLLGVGTGSLVLALVLGLLLGWSVISPLRRTQGRLSAIAGGDFGGHVEVANRDEIGQLAADVNKMNDELARLYRQLELASEHKSQFLANMSHELRTPLNAIIGFSEVLREQMFGELNERQLAYVEDVLAAGEHLLSLINDVLDLAKIEAGRMDLELSQVEIPDLLRTAVSMHSERAGRSGVSLSLETEPAEIEIIADERRVRQIVFNLLSNAVKFTPSGGHVDISARTETGQVEIAVADTGHGIAAEDLDTIFEEFEQTSEGKRAEGTGLGLPLSRKLAELHGGRLWAQSELGKGSTFRFSLPVEQEVS